MLILEFGGGVAVVLGIYPWVAPALIDIEMLTGTVWKITKAHKPFPDYSYDLLALALALVFLAVGPGVLSLG